MASLEQVLWVAMDETAFDFMDSITPGCVAMFPSGDSVSQTTYPLVAAASLYTALSKGISLVLIGEHLVIVRSACVAKSLQMKRKSIRLNGVHELLEACTGMIYFRREEGGHDRPLDASSLNFVGSGFDGPAMSLAPWSASLSASLTS